MKTLTMSITGMSCGGCVSKDSHRSRRVLLAIWLVVEARGFGTAHVALVHYRCAQRCLASSSAYLASLHGRCHTVPATS
jgi:hypothetical protein